MEKNPIDQPLSFDSYVNFDGDSIRDAIKNRLTSLGLFTDQNFEGSNLAHFNEILAYVFSLLLFSLNKTSNEGMFTESQLYENMNKIVKSMDYKPIGHQTSTLAFNVKAVNLENGVYSIPRYSFIEIGGIKYSFSEDISFSKTTDLLEEELKDFEDSNLLYQGSFIEYPTILASGNKNEIITLNVGDSVMIDHFNIHVYVKDSITNKWNKWNKTNSLFLNKSNDLVYEIRLNEKKSYEIKFGNNINGNQLKKDDQILIVYLQTSGKAGEVGANVLTGKNLTFYKSNKLTEILNDIAPYRTFYQFNPVNKLKFSNIYPSTYYSSPESVDSIRENAPGLFRSQYRVVTQNDYETYVKTNFSNLIEDVKCFNNSEFLENYLSYFSDLGLLNSNLESRALFNQVKYSDSCNFNNVYLFVVPKSINGNLNYVNPSQKQLIIDSIKEEQIITSQTILMDPVYLEFDLCLNDTTGVSISNRDHTQLIIEKQRNTKIPDDIIKNEVYNSIISFFSKSNNKLGTVVDINKLTSDILSISGVNKIYTFRSDLNIKEEGLKFISWIPAYPERSLTVINSNKSLADFEFPFLSKKSNLNNRILIKSNGSDFESLVA